MVTVHLRTLGLPPAEDPAEDMGALLDADEAGRAGRLRRDADRAAFVAAHGTKRLLLGGLLGADPASLRFRTEREGGKPVLDRPGSPDLRFSLSHAEGMVACAAAFGTEVGIDVEPVGRPVEPDLAAHHFAPDEARWLAGLPAAARDEAFIALWTCKEAVVKAVGLGLAIGLETFAVRPAFPLCSGPPHLLRHAGLVPTGHRCALRQWRPGPRHLAALAVILPQGEEILGEEITVISG